MNKYFDKNFIADDALDFGDVGGVLWDAFQVLSHNVEFKASEPYLKRKHVEGRESELDENLAGSALMMIGACEALLSKLDPEAVETAGEDVEKKLAKDPKDELGGLLRYVMGGPVVVDV